jgi:foldase protein PrsA
VRKLIRFSAAFGAVALLITGTAACKSAEPYAVKVNGQVVSKSDFDDELKAIRDNKEYRQAVEQSVQVTGTGSDTFNQQFVAQVLTRRVYFTLVHQEFVRRNLKITRTDLSNSRSEVVRAMGGAGIFAAFPKTYQTFLVNTNAEVDVLANKLADTSAPNLRRYYNEHLDQFESVCAAHILVDTKAKADSIETQLAKAKDKKAAFADLAKKNSKDTGSGEKGGDLGCAAPSNYVAEFKDAVRTQKIGVIGQPVKTQFGYHIIRDDSREPAKPFAEVKDQVKSAITDSQQGAFTQFLTEASTKAKVEVNPRFGTFDTTGQQPQVVPPKSPANANNSGG